MALSGQIVRDGERARAAGTSEGRDEAGVRQSGEMELANGGSRGTAVRYGRARAPPKKEAARLLGSGLFLLLGLLLLDGEFGLIGRFRFFLAFGHREKLPAQAEVARKALNTPSRASLEGQKIKAEGRQPQARELPLK